MIMTIRNCPPWRKRSQYNWINWKLLTKCQFRPKWWNILSVIFHQLSANANLKLSLFVQISNVIVWWVCSRKLDVPGWQSIQTFMWVACRFGGHSHVNLFPTNTQIWTYEHARDVAYFDGLNHLIISVGLVKPKPDVFIADVKYLLVITTTIEIVVLGVIFGDSSKSLTSPSSATHRPTFEPAASPLSNGHSNNIEEMQLMSKPIFILNTDNVAITTVCGTADNRIFLGGRDGCLYEIYYQAESNWFGRRCKKINHSQGLMSYMVPGFLKVFSVRVFV